MATLEYITAKSIYITFYGWCPLLIVSLVHISDLILISVVLYCNLGLIYSILVPAVILRHYAVRFIM
jgi:hypothetical protein